MADENYRIDRDYLEKLFVYVYCDLGLRFEALREEDQRFRLYNQLNIARLIRQLVVDGSSLCEQVNREYRLQLVALDKGYGGAPADLKPIPEIYDHIPRSTDMLLPGMYFKPLPIRQWLETTSMNLGDNPIKQRVVIKYVANQYGGVHLEPELDDEVHQAMARFQSRLRVGTDDPVINQLNNIANEILWTLRPLKEAVDQRLREVEGNT